MLKIVILGANGMLGASLFRYFSKEYSYEVFGSVRRDITKQELLKLKGFNGKITSGIDALNFDSIHSYLTSVQPDIIFNCIGVIKQKEENTDKASTIYINSVLPHEIAKTASSLGAKLIHFSTDCIFNGEKGNYNENDFANADDTYGRSKKLGEIESKPHLTLRTSIIGHELTSNNSLIDWFLSQTGVIKGYSNAIFSGMPTCYIAEIANDILKNHPELSGLYHLSVAPIDKCTLLELVKNIYDKEIKIEPYTAFCINRSLDSSLLRETIKLSPLKWGDLIQKMHNEYLKYFEEK